MKTTEQPAKGNRTLGRWFVRPLVLIVVVPGATPPRTHKKTTQRESGLAVDKCTWCSGSCWPAEAVPWSVWCQTRLKLRKPRTQSWQFLFQFGQSWPFSDTSVDQKIHSWMKGESANDVLQLCNPKGQNMSLVTFLCFFTLPKRTRQNPFPKRKRTSSSYHEHFHERREPNDCFFMFIRKTHMLAEVCSKAAGLPALHSKSVWHFLSVMKNSHALHDREKKYPCFEQASVDFVAIIDSGSIAPLTSFERPWMIIRCHISHRNCGVQNVDAPEKSIHFYATRSSNITHIRAASFDLHSNDRLIIFRRKLLRVTQPLENKTKALNEWLMNFWHWKEVPEHPIHNPTHSRLASLPFTHQCPEK